MNLPGSPQPMPTFPAVRRAADLPPADPSPLRVEWIDTLKGFGVVAVMLYHHIGISGFATNFLISFNVPLFFILSGFLFTQTPGAAAFPRFAARQVAKVAVPYLVFAALGIAVWMLLHPQDRSVDTLAHFLTGVAYGVGSPPWLTFNRPLWFLPAFFASGILFFFCKTLLTRRLALSLPLLLVATSLTQAIPFRLPWGLDIAPMTLLFMTVGHAARRRGWQGIVERHPIDVFVVAALISYLAVTYNGHTGMSFKSYGNPILYALGGISGTALMVCLSQRYYSGLITLIGRHSLVLFAAHMPVYFLLNEIVFGVLNVSFDLRATYAALLYLAIALTVLIPASIFLKRKAPLLVGGPA